MDAPSGGFPSRPLSRKRRQITYQIPFAKNARHPLDRLFDNIRAIVSGWSSFCD